jgi:Ca-activated chloride channel family protein
VLTSLKLTATNDVRLTEVYPPQLPDLFHGQQLLVLARYTGKGPSAVRLTGMVGRERKEFAYDVTFPDKTGDDKAFVEEIWARRKVGYLLDQIRINGEKKELVDEVVALARKYGIATPYTSWLIVPDSAVPVAGGRPGSVGGPGAGIGLGGGGFNGGSQGVPTLGLMPRTPGQAPQKVVDFARTANSAPGGQAAARGGFESKKYAGLPADGKGDKDALRALDEAKSKQEAYELAREALAQRRQADVQVGKLGVDLSVQMNNLRTQSRLEYTAQRNVQGRTCTEIGGVWIDEGFTDKTPVVAVKAQSDAYFRILERHARVKEVLQLGNHLVWLTPSGTALVIDTSDGKDKLGDEEIDKLFVAKPNPSPANSSGKPSGPLAPPLTPEPGKRPEARLADPGLQRVVAAWPQLPEHIKAAVLTLVGSAG